MFTDKKAFSGFSVNDLEKAEKFYHQVLGIETKKEGVGLVLKLKSGATAFIYPKADHKPASFTILNFPVDNIDEAVDELREKGVMFEDYNDVNMPQDSKGILRGLSAHMGPDIAWFKDPASNILAILQEA